jgi:hypothetical protein
MQSESGDGHRLEGGTQLEAGMRHVLPLVFVEGREGVEAPEDDSGQQLSVHVLSLGAASPTSLLCKRSNIVLHLICQSPLTLLRLAPLQYK